MKCFACNKPFKKRLSEIKVSARHFCSRDCFQKTWANDPKPHKRTLIVPICHPERQHHAKGMCAECYGLDYAKANPEARKNAANGYAKRHPARLRDSRLRHQYGITAKAFAVKFKEQGGLCAVCHTREATDVDHRHSDKQVRDLLCRTCNQALGLLRESIAIVYSAAAYLEKWEARAQA